MLQDANTLLLLGVILVAGFVGGNLAKHLHLPSVTGQILVGILLGPSVLALFRHHDVQRLEPVIEFALGLMAVAVGSHLQFHRLRVAKRRLLLLLALEATITPLLVFGAVAFLPGTQWQVAVLLAAIAISTAPATILALVKETHSRGVFVKTLVAAVALNNLACISVFELTNAAARASLVTGSDSSLGTILMAPVKQILASGALGVSVGLLLILVTRKVIRSDRLATLSMIAILLTSGLADHLEVSGLLACLFLGITLANLTPDKEEIGHEVFDNFELAIFAVFFTVAGMELSFSAMGKGGLLAVLAFAGRFAGKVVAARAAMHLAKATTQVKRWLGVALIPQAGLAVGLMLLITEDPAYESLAELFLAVVLTLVLLNEIVGPILTRLALKRSGEFGQDRERVLDFLHEENITTNLTGDTKEAAIRQLVDLAIRSNGLTVPAEELLEQVLHRESESSTCIGEGLSIPHARLDIDTGMLGALGISRRGLRLDTPDGEPVHCMVLLITPTHMPDRHLEVLSALAKVIGMDRLVKHELYSSSSPAHAYDVLHQGEESEDFNYFLDDAELPPEPNDSLPRPT